MNACIVADDLTGAADTGVQFAGVGEATYVFFSWTDLRQAFTRCPGSTYSIDTASRPVDRQSAYDQTFRALGACVAQRPAILYLKLDSALRGQVGAALSALKARIPDRPIPVVCAFPETGRTTVDGRQLADGTPIDAHEMGQDALTPVKTAHIPSLLAEWGPSSTVPLDEVRSGRLPDRLADATRGGVHFVVIDAETRGDLDRIAGDLVAWHPTVVCAGSGGLAGSLAKLTVGDAAPPGPETRADTPERERTPDGGPLASRGPALTVTTSLKSVTARQLDVLQAAHPETLRLELRPSRLKGSGSQGDEVNALAQIACRALQAGIDVIVHAVPEAAVDPDAGPPLLQAIAKIVGEAYRCAPVALTMAVGGDTAAAVLRSVGAEGILLVRELVPGVALGRIAGGPYHGKTFVTKSGGFGTPETLVTVRHLAIPAGA